jgi:hypothetical protein
MAENCREELLALDGGRNFGLLTRASGTSRRTAVLLLNAGLIHRTGPFRLHVHLARTLAAQGMDVLRFDMPRIGDADAGSLAGSEAVVTDALDALQSATGCTGFIVGGLCSAADRAWLCASRDNRVTGVLLIDGMAVRNAWFRVGQFGLMLRRGPAAWAGMITRALRARAAHAPRMADFREWPGAEEFRDQTARMLQRGVRILALYTGGVAYYMLHPRQLDATFGVARKHPGLELVFRPELDHMLFDPADRERMIERIRNWAVAG